MKVTSALGPTFRSDIVSLLERVPGPAHLGEGGGGGYGGELGVPGSSQRLMTTHIEFKVSLLISSKGIS